MQSVKRGNECDPIVLNSPKKLVPCFRNCGEDWSRAREALAQWDAEPADERCDDEYGTNHKNEFFDDR